MHRYVWLYNQQLPQSALGSKAPLQAMKDWHKLKPELFKKQPYYLPGCDSYPLRPTGKTPAYPPRRNSFPIPRQGRIPRNHKSEEGGPQIALTKILAKGADQIAAHPTKSSVR
jgi:hypothetical protein